MPRRFSFERFALAAVLLLAIGCDTKKVTDAVSSGVEQAKTTVAKTVETARQEVNLAGSMELSTVPPVAAKAGYAKLLVLDGSRPNVLQIASYKDAEFERFPSLFVQAPVEANAMGELTGKTLKATLFAQAGKDDGVWQTRPNAPVSLIVSAVDATSVTCQFTSATLVNMKSGEEAVVNGKFIAMVQ